MQLKSIPLILLLSWLPISLIMPANRLITTGLLLLIVSSSIIFRSWPRNLKLIDWGIIGLYTSCIFATVMSPFPKESIYGLVKYSLYFAFYIAIAQLLADNRQILKVLVLASIPVVIIGLMQSIWGVDALATWQDPELSATQVMNRVYASFGNPNLMSAYLLGIWPIGIYLTLHYYKGKKPLLLIGNLILTLLLVYLIIQSGSRGAWLALSAQAGIFGLWLIKSLPKRWSISLIGAGLISVYIYLQSHSAILHRLSTFLRPLSDSSNLFRLNVWNSCIELVRDNWLFGIGPGSKAFYQAYGIYMHSTFSSLGAYSVPFEILIEMGILGLVFYLILAGLVLYYLVRELLRATPRPLILILSIALIGYLISGLFDIVIMRVQVIIPLLLTLTLLRNNIHARPLSIIS